MRSALIVAVLPALFACNGATAQVGVRNADDAHTWCDLAAWGGPRYVSRTDRIPLGSTEIISGGLSPAPAGVTGTIAIPSTSSGTGVLDRGNVTINDVRIHHELRWRRNGMGMGIEPERSATAGNGQRGDVGQHGNVGIVSVIGDLELLPNPWARRECRPPQERWITAGNVWNVRPRAQAAWLHRRPQHRRRRSRLEASTEPEFRLVRLRSAIL